MCVVGIVLQPLMMTLHHLGVGKECGWYLLNYSGLLVVEYSTKNMFYTTVQPETLLERCEETLGVNHDFADITYFAADHRFSYNHTIWSRDPEVQSNRISKVIAFGDSLSDTGNIFNASQWRFPNPDSWFLGHFSNGFVWTEYLAQGLNVPLYNWAVESAAKRNQYVALTGVYEQVSSYLSYMRLAKTISQKTACLPWNLG